MDLITVTNTRKTRELFYRNNFDECKVIALQGIRAIIEMYGGKGGVVIPNRLHSNNKKLFSECLDILLWVSIRKKEYSSALFYLLHLQRMNYYTKSKYDNIYSIIKDKVEFSNDKVTKVMLTCKWMTDNEKLFTENLNLFDDITISNDIVPGFETKDSKFILTTNCDLADYYVILWGTNTNIPIEKSIFFRTEPIYPDKLYPGKKDKMDPFNFLRFFDYEDARYPNGTSIWLGGKKYLETIDKKIDNVVSTVVSGKYVSKGHKLRIDFLRYAVKESSSTDNLSFDVFGWKNWNFSEDSYKGSLPYKDKSKALFPYKYTFNAENTRMKGYFTEKIVDAILSECLIFYWGCPNLEDIFGCTKETSPFIELNLEDKAESFRIITDSVKNNEWEKRLPYIKNAKERILNNLMYKHRIINVIEEEKVLQMYGEDAMNLLRLAKSTFPGTYDTKMFPVIYYNGARFELFEYIVSKYGTKLEKSSWPSSKLLKDSIPLMQEFANFREESELQSYTVGHSRFTIRNFHLPDPPKTFVINLKRRPDRLLNFDKNFRASASWNYNVFEAFDGKEMLKNGLSEENKKIFDCAFGKKPGEIGCALSHYTLWKNLVDDKNNDKYLIFEDDVEFMNSYEWKFYCGMQKIEHGWDMIFLGHHIFYEYITTHFTNGELPRIEPMTNYIIPKRTSVLGTASYMISKRGARKLVDHIQSSGIHCGIDYLIQLLFPDTINAYGFNPMINFSHYWGSPLVPEADFDTDVQK